MNAKAAHTQLIQSCAVKTPHDLLLYLPTTYLQEEERESAIDARGRRLRSVLLKACAELRSCASQLATTNALRTAWLTKNYCAFY